MRTMMVLQVRGVALLMGALVMASAVQAQDSLEHGKTPAQLYASDCAICHKSPLGLSKAGGLFGVQSFLREHYTTSRETAAAIAAYLEAIDRAAGPAPRGAAPKRGAKSTGGKPAAKKPERDKPAEVKPQEPKASESKATETKAVEPKASESKASDQGPAEAKSAEPKSAEPKPTELKASEPKPSESKPAESAKPEKPE